MIRLLVVGKIKESFYREAIQEYVKRLSGFTKLEIVEVEDSKLEEKLARKQEAALLLSKIKDKEFVITLEIEGKTYDSLRFAKELENLETHYSNLCFIIGGSYGLEEEVKRRSNLAISFSPLTFPHQLFRVIVLEQIYRAYKIRANESYHK